MRQARAPVMCGRFVISVPDLTELVAAFGAVELRASDWRPRWNVAPTQPAPVVTNERARAVTQMQFGLVPPWAARASEQRRTRGSGGASMINARVETVATKGAFRKALERRRCVIPVSGYYEWKKLGDRKQPMFIHTPGKLIPLSGVWERWTSHDGEVVESFAILTRPATGFVRDIHDRMPLELPADALDLWLDPKPKTAEELAPILKAEAGAEHLVAHPVSPLVNTVANDTPACIEPVAELPPRAQLDLFATAPSRKARTE